MGGTQLLLTFMNGLTLGGLLFMVASGFTLIFGLMRVVNLAHGAFYLWGGYIGLTVTVVTGNFWVGLLAGTVIVAIGGGVAERLLFRRVRGDLQAEILLAIGLSFVLADVALAVFGGDSLSIVPADVLRGNIEIFGVRYPTVRVGFLIIAIIVLLVLWVILTKTRIGSIVRAGVDDREMLGAMGINVGVVFTAMFVFGAALAGLAGVAGGTFLSLYPGADSEILLFALVVVVVGGLGSLWGAALGAVLVGTVISFGTTLMPEFLYFLMFGPMLAVLIARPQGLMGRTI
jgi:branched-chain amino acid transport system permease protein